MSNLYIPDVYPPQSPEQELQLRVRFCPYRPASMEAHVKYPYETITYRPALFVEDHGPLIDESKIRYINVAVLSKKDGKRKASIKSVTTAKLIAETVPVTIPSSGEIMKASLDNDQPKWIEQGDELYCPACGYGNLLSLLKEIAVPFERFPRHCPHCGTELDPEGKHEHLESAHS